MFYDEHVEEFLQRIRHYIKSTGLPLIFHYGVKSDSRPEAAKLHTCLLELQWESDLLSLFVFVGIKP